MVKSLKTRGIPPKMGKGRFISVEGGEGAGKSTHVELLTGWLREHGIDAVATREPGGAPGADAIRAILVEGPTDRWDAHSEALLHFAARREHLVHTIWPALRRGQWVVCDRFADSTMAYQGYGHRLGRAAIETLYELAVGDFAPDLTLIMDLPIEAGLARTAGRGGSEDRYERMSKAFHQRLRDGFLDIARREPERCVVIDATPEIHTVAEKVREAVASRLALEAR